MNEIRNEPGTQHKEARLEALREQLRRGEYRVDTQRLTEALARAKALRETKATTPN